MRILVTGGTGDLGRRVVSRLEKADHDVLVGTRRPSQPSHFHYDLSEAANLSGIDAVVHLASNPLRPRDDVEGSARLWKAAAEAGVDHAIYISIVGVDDHPFAYYRAKREVEEQLETSGLPHTILRATQFHGLIPRFIDEVGRRTGVVPLPAGFRFQPVDAELVADRVGEIVEQGPSGRMADVGGPEVLTLEEMAAGYLAARGRRWPRMRLPLGGRAATAFREGKHLAPHAITGGTTFSEFLAHVPRHRPDHRATSLRLVAVALLASTLWMLVSPGGFHTLVAGFGDLNTHYIRDTATFVLPLGLALWLAASRPTWRRPVLALALLQNGAHVLNHLADVGNADPTWQGPVNLASLVVLQVVLFYLYRATARRAVTAA